MSSEVGDEDLYGSAQAAYVGEYCGGKREGSGHLILPDGGVYEGQFKADKFEGHVGNDDSLAPRGTSESR